MLNLLSRLAKTVEGVVVRVAKVVVAEITMNTTMATTIVTVSPGHVFDLASDEAMANFSDEVAVLYDMTIAESVDYLNRHFDDVLMNDSPLQSLALLRVALDGTSVLNDHRLIDNDVSTLMAIFLGSASDTTVPISEDPVLAVIIILISI